MSSSCKPRVGRVVIVFLIIFVFVTNRGFLGVGSGLKLDFSLRTQFNITRRLLGHKSEILIVQPASLLSAPPGRLSPCELSHRRFSLQVADEETLPLSVSFPPGGQAAYPPVSNTSPASIQTVKELSILAVASRDPTHLNPNTASTMRDRFDTDMQLRAVQWQRSDRNESSDVEK